MPDEKNVSVSVLSRGRRTGQMFQHPSILILEICSVEET
jgi:hypothetical protein